MRAISTVVIGILLLVFSALSRAQTADELGIVLTGKLDRPHWRIQRDGALYARFLLQMNFENKGKQPVILINPNLGYGTGLKEARLSYFSWYRGEPLGALSATSTFELTGSRQIAFRAAATLFDDVKPPENYTFILEPGESRPFNEAVSVEIPLSAEARKEAPKYFKNWGIELKDVQLTYEFSFLPYIEATDFLETLNQRWRRYGQLPIGPSGTYTIVSEKIKLADR